MMAAGRAAEAAESPGEIRLEHLRAAGIMLVALSLVHVVFPKQFQWSQELPG